MKILILSSDIGTSAPGIVYMKLIEGLSRKHDVDLITADFNPSTDLNSIKKITEIKDTRIPTRVHKFIFTLFGINPFDLLWSRKVNKFIKNFDNTNYDLIFSLISFNHYAALICSEKLSKCYNIKHFVYSVDAIPAPLGWLKDDLFFKKTKKLIAKLLSDVDGIFLANQKMLEYQLNIVNPKNKIATGVIYNPSYGKLQTLDFTGGETNTFLYTGGIYGPRKICFVIEAFREILKEYPNSTLEFVGSTIPENNLKILTKTERSKVIIHPFTKDLTQFYQRATALLDIDADLENDVFLSSKITNYITINRIIISETGVNSPSRKIFKNIPSIFQCLHNKEMLTTAMRNSIRQRDIIDFKDRSEIIALFDLETVTDKINNVISK